jgi:exodeoxyribonuclease V alpha subunit
VDASKPVDWQCVAAFAAARKKFCVISGGPGTGKTHTLVVILAMLLDMEPNRKLRIAVAAPTGKAAARIQDSIRSIKTTLPCSDAVKAQLPERAMTLHRLLGNVPDSAYFRHNAGNQLPYDVIAVDEASMVDLALMAKLFQAVPASARVILLGDKDQLASVEAGAVLGDICSAPALDRFSRDFGDEFKQLTGWTLPASAGIERPPGLTDGVVQLRKNHRFSKKSAIFQLSTAINDGLIDVALDILRRGSSEPGGDLASATLPPRTKLKIALKDKLIGGFREFLETNDPLQALGAMNRFRILCALREGAFGVAGLNRLAEELLEEAGLIHAGSTWYSHRPLMITRNDYNLKLFNGDIGVILPEPENGDPRAFFVGPGNTLRKFLPIRLPECETAYAMTVHKSQGSEFDRVLMILPDRESPVLSRELLYTGITRARMNVELWFDEGVFRKGLSRRVQRTSGLSDALWNGDLGPQDNR